MSDLSNALNWIGEVLIIVAFWACLIRGFMAWICCPKFVAPLVYYNRHAVGRIFSSDKPRGSAYQVVVTVRRNALSYSVLESRPMSGPPPIPQ